MMNEADNLSRRNFVQAAVISAGVMLGGCAMGADAEKRHVSEMGDSGTELKNSSPFDVGGDRQLFIDDQLVHHMDRVAFTVNPPQRREFVLYPTTEWERGGITCYATVFWDEMHKQFRLYYVPTCDAKPTFRLALATSTDGIHWERPSLGVVEFNGSRDNNIVIDGQREGTVFVDPNAPPERRYGYLSGNKGTGMYYFSSPDGIHFNKSKAPVTSYWSDSQMPTFWDPARKKYVSYPRAFYEGNGKWRLSPRLVFSRNIVPPTDVNLQRAVTRIETDSADGPWESPLQVVMTRDDRDPPGVDLYTNSAHKYAVAPNVYVAFPTPYYHYNEPGRAYLNQPTLDAGGKGNDGTIDTQLATSRDGIAWTRHRTSYVPLCHLDGLDLKICMIFPGMLYHPDRIDQYFAGYTHTYGDTQARHRLKGRELGGVVRLTQRIDGFTSMDFDYEGGRLITRPISFKGKQLVLNVQTAAAGEGRVAILDAAGKGIPDFDINDCRIINGDYLNKTVEWTSGKDLSGLEGSPIRLLFEMRGTKLFSFRFAEAPSNG